MALFCFANNCCSSGDRALFPFKWVYKIVYSASIGEKMRSLRCVNLEIWHFSGFRPETPFISNGVIKSKCANEKVASNFFKFYQCVF